MSYKFVHHNDFFLQEKKILIDQIQNGSQFFEQPDLEISFNQNVNFDKDVVNDKNKTLLGKMIPMCVPSYIILYVSTKLHHVPLR